MNRFNPTRVRLKRVVLSRRSGSSLGFNPTRVRLKPAHIRRKMSSGCFNPTRVRLKLLSGRFDSAISKASTPQGFV